MTSSCQALPPAELVSVLWDGVREARNLAKVSKGLGGDPQEVTLNGVQSILVIQKERDRNV